MSINIGVPEKTTKLRPRVLVLGVGGGGCNALNTMIASKLKGVEFVACNTDAQSLDHCNSTHKIQLGVSQTQGLGAGCDPAIGKASAEESYNEICEYIEGAHMAFITAGMGGGTGTGAVPVIAKACREKGILTVAVVTKPFAFEGNIKMQNAEKGIKELREFVDTLIVIPNQNLFIVSDDKTSYAEALSMADQVLYAGVRGITDLMMLPGLINLDFADVKSVMSEMGRAVLGNGEAAGEKRAIEAAEAAIANPLLDHVSMQGAKGLLMNISGGTDMSLVEVDEAANRIKEEVDPEAKIIYGSSINKELDGLMRVSIVATGIENVFSLKEKDKKSNLRKDVEISNENLISEKVNEPITSKLQEQTDLEDFTNPVEEIDRNTDFNHSNDKILNKLTEAQTKPTNKVLEFIKKFSPLKIFQGTKEEMIEVKKDIFNTNEEVKKETKKEEEKVASEPKIETKEDIKKEDEKQGMENKNNEVKKELSKDEHNSLEIQAEMPGLSSSDPNLPESNENIDKKNDNDGNNEEDLKIPSFLRNQSN